MRPVEIHAFANCVKSSDWSYMYFLLNLQRFLYYDCAVLGTQYVKCNNLSFSLICCMCNVFCTTFARLSNQFDLPARAAAATPLRRRAAAAAAPRRTFALLHFRTFAS